MRWPHHYAMESTTHWTKRPRTALLEVFMPDDRLIIGDSSRYTLILEEDLWEQV